MQADCNLVLYINRTRSLWASGTDKKGINCRATSQNNGNLVVLAGNNDVLWTSGTPRGPQQLPPDSADRRSTD
ncbi:hypothetical protein EJ110_NYTH07924 [Nymphaea thermarum]|nr:hypothetical protein EJ110_NYTH07924 [Nymphaea thermarum]